MENCNLRKYCCTFMVKMMMPVLAAASLNLQPINLQFVQKLAILQLYKIFLFHWWYDGGVKSSVSSIFLHTVIFSYSYIIILLLLFWTFVMDGFFLVNCSMTGKTLSCHWSSKIRLLWWHTLNWGGGTPAHYLQPLGKVVPQKLYFHLNKRFLGCSNPCPPWQTKIRPQLGPEPI